MTHRLFDANPQVDGNNRQTRAKGSRKAGRVVVVVEVSVVVVEVSNVRFGIHLYQPLLHLSKSNLIEVSPVSLNDSERGFVLDLKKFHDEGKDFFKGRELFLLRNVTRWGIGFFEAGNFYPDFILWLLAGEKQYVTFVDPKGLRQLDDGSSSLKIQFYRTIKDIESRLADPNVILNSFIVSQTPFRNIPMWVDGMKKSELQKCHVLSQKDDKETYIKTLLTKVVGANA